DSQLWGRCALDPRLRKLKLAVAIVFDTVGSRRIRVGGRHELHTKISVHDFHRQVLRHDVGQVVGFEAVPTDHEQVVEFGSTSLMENVLDRCEAGAWPTRSPQPVQRRQPTGRPSSSASAQISAPLASIYRGGAVSRPILCLPEPLSYTLP